MDRTLRLRPWKPGDEDAFEVSADVAAERAMVAWDWSKGPPGPTWTLVRWSGEVAGVGGFHETARDARGATFQAWCWLADLPRRDWPKTMWLAGRAIDHAARHHGARRLEATASARMPGAALCLQRLGFEWTGDVEIAGARYRVMTWGD